MAKQCIKKITVTMETYVQFIPLISTDVYYHIEPGEVNLRKSRKLRKFQGNL